MDHSLNESIRFGDCRLSEDGILITPGGERQLTRRLAVILRALAYADGSIVGSDRLLDSFWGRGSGNPQNLAKAVFQLREALADAQHVCVDSVYGHGYRLQVLKTATGIPDARSKALTISEEAGHRSSDRFGSSLESALLMYQAATKIDGACVSAYLGYAQTLMQMMANGLKSSSLGWPAARQALKDALQHDPASADIHALMAKGQCLFDWDIDSALTSLEMAIRLAPGDYVPNEAAGRIALFRGKPEDAVEYARRALFANPMAMRTWGILAFALECAGELKASLECLDEARQLDPGNPTILSYATWHIAANGDAEEACKIGAKLYAISPHSTSLTSVYAFALASAGRTTEARSLLASIKIIDSPGMSYSATASRAWAVLGDREAAVRELADSARNRDYWLGIMLNHPTNDCLRAESGFQDIYEAVFGSRAH